MTSRAPSRTNAASRSGADRARLRRILSALDRAIAEPRVELAHRTPWQLLVATILSAQCTDQRVNEVTPALFERYPGPREMAAAEPGDLEALIRPTGFFRSKARSLIGCGRAIVERCGGRVPDTMAELVTLPGVGRKTANVLLGACFGKPAVVVDTHVKRVARRLGLARSEDPDKIEAELQRALPEHRWTSGSQRLLLHGRYVCLARNPKCGECAVYADCAWPGKRPT